jgi:transcriptional regulator with XRE-family HTH domain
MITMAIVQHKGEGVIGALKEARQAAGLSQRALSNLAGLSQSHVSEIENGSKDPGLSKLIDVARALDLELILVPRRMLPAVESLIHPADIERRSPAYAIDVLDRAERQVKKQQALYGPNTNLDRMREALKFMRRAPVKPEDIERIKKDTEQLRRYQASPQSADLVKAMASDWTQLRNRLAHAVDEPPRPAFSLDDEGGDA